MGAEEPTRPRNQEEAMAMFLADLERSRLFFEKLERDMGSKAEGPRSTDAAGYIPDRAKHEGSRETRESESCRKALLRKDWGERVGYPTTRSGRQVRATVGRIRKIMKAHRREVEERLRERGDGSV
jgi:hypothetical protein